MTVTNEINDGAIFTSTTVRMPRNFFSGHIPALDGVRGLAVLMVMVLHFVNAVDPINSIETALHRISGYLVYGVDLFFVLSGFLITGILYDSKNKVAYFRNFYIRRSLRIFPLYYGVMVVLLVILPRMPYFHSEVMSDMVSAQIWAWTYTMNFYVAKVGIWSLPYINHFWSLAIEEHFYLCWPLVVFFFDRKTLLKVTVFCIIFALSTRVVLDYSGINELAISTLTPCRLDGLALGAFLAVLVRGGGEPDKWLPKLKKIALSFIVIWAAIFLGIFFFHMVTDFGYVFLRHLRETCFVLICASILIAAVTSSPGTYTKRFFSSSSMTFLGKYSYGLYVFHVMVSAFMRRIDSIKWAVYVVRSHTLAMIVQLVIGIGLSIIIAWMSYNLYEKHFLLLKSRFEIK